MQFLVKLSKLLHWLPYELNAKVPDMQLQLCEAFEISYFDEGHQTIRLRRDNAPMSAPHDTGVKVTALLVINKDNKGDKEYGEINLRHRIRREGELTKWDESSFKLKHNQLLLMRARNVEYEIQAKKEKVFVVAMRMAGGRSAKY